LTLDLVPTEIYRLDCGVIYTEVVNLPDFPFSYL
jgi:hypothetical protein